MSVYDNNTFNARAKTFLENNGIRVLKNNNEDHTDYNFYYQVMDKRCIIACLDFTNATSLMSGANKSGDIFTISRVKFPTIFIINQDNQKLINILIKLKDNLCFSDYIIITYTSFCKLICETDGFVEEIYIREEKLKSIPNEDGRKECRRDAFEFTREKLYSSKIAIIYDPRENQFDRENYL